MRFGQGFDYAYLFPGMSRVVQAAGRVIRAPEDRAAVVLVGRRSPSPVETKTVLLQTT